jgi:hypothetical protein
LRDTILAMPTYLEVTVDGQTLSPREPISSVPYAMLSESMPPASISSDMLRTAAVTSDKLAAGSVTANALAAGSVTANAIQGASITGEKIAPFSITGASINFSTIHGDRIINESLTGTDILNGSLTGADLASGTISNSALAANAVTGNTIADGTVSNIDLAVDAVTSLTVADGSVSNVDLAANAVTSDRIQDGTLTADDVASNTFWSTLGNAGTETGTHFLGTTDGRPLEIRAAGVGIGTTNPAGSLHVASGTVNAPAPSSGTVLVLERAGANYISMLAPTNSEQGILFGDSNDSVEGAIMFNSPGVTNGLQFRTLNNNTRMTIDSAGRVGIGTTTPTNLLHVAGTVQATAYITGSDRNMKENIAPVSPDTILEKVAALPIATWTFKDEPNGTHIGPMAQDFHAAFGFGNTDTGIMTVDADGVALAAIQALAREREAMKDEVSVFGVRVSELEEENARLRADLEMIKGKLGL